MTRSDDILHQRRRLLSRRRFMQIAGLTAGGLLLPGCLNESDATPAATATMAPEADETMVEAVSGYDNPTVWAERTLTVTSWGGEYEEAQQRAIFEPFERLTGAKIEVDASDNVQLRRMVEDGSTRWDVSDVLTEEVLQLANLGVLETIDYNVVETDGLFAEARLDHGVSSSFYSTVMAYRTDRWIDIPPPGSWSDFWDIGRFPGTRGLHREPQGTLEFALLADGVELDALYPLDRERAFASLDRIVADMTLWWEQGAQPVQMVTAGDLDMVSVWHSRIYRLESEAQNVGISWNGGALSGDSWVIPKGAPNLDVAMDFINFATRPEVCAAFSTLVPFGPVNANTFDFLPPEIANRLPTAPQHRAVQFTTNFEWWFQHREAVQAEFDEWFSTHP